METKRNKCEKEIKLRYLMYDSGDKYTGMWTYSKEVAIEYAKLKGCYIKYEINNLIIDPIKNER